jgi:hypothetical protein
LSRVRRQSNTSGGSGVNTALVSDQPLTMHAARLLTDEVKADTAALWAKLLRLYDGDAHTALGFSSWGEYYAAEFNESGRRGYQLLDAARVVAVLEPVNNCSLTYPIRRWFA